MRIRLHGLLVFFSLLLLQTISAFAQSHHSQADVWLEYDAYQPNMKVGLYIELDPDWHTYWLSAGDTGMPPTMDITINQLAPLTLSPIIAPAPKRFSTATSESFGYDQTVLFYRTLALDPSITEKDFPLTLSVDVAWLVCKEICIPNQQIFTLPLLAPSSQKQKPRAAFGDYQYPVNHTPMAWDVRVRGDKTTLTFEQLSKKDFVDFFPYQTNSRAWLRPTQVIHNTDNTQFEYATTEPLSQGLWVQYDDHHKPYVASWAYPSGQLPTTGQNNTPSVAWILLLAFLGGLLLNAMPCVFPVLSLKAMSLISEQSPHQKSWFRTTAYTLGTMTTMVLLGFLVVLFQQTGQAVGWGFQLQSPSFVLALMFLFTLLALTFWGRMDIPGLRIHGKLGQRMHQANPWGDFFTGAIVVGVATPCTAPFMGIAMGVALTQSAWMILATFACLGFGLAFPFFVLHLFPSLTRMLPKPGAWMEHVSKVLALPLVLSVVWLGWVLQGLTHPWASWVGVACCVALALCLFWRSFRVFSRILILAAAFWGLAWGIMQVLEQSTPPTKQTIMDARWQPYSKELLQKHLGDQKPVLIDFTADWCLTCQVNHRLTFTDDAVWDRIKQADLQMLRADWTRRDPAITQALKDMGRIGVPVYALWIPGHHQPVLLPSILTSGVFLEALEKNL